jgi:hypothetical protein
MPPTAHSVQALVHIQEWLQGDLEQVEARMRAIPLRLNP